MTEGAGRPTIVSVSSSSKKAGKSMVASFLVRELGADFGLKVSSGGHAPSPVVTDPQIISRPGTDTAALVEAGAGKVVWVNASAGSLAAELADAMSLFPPDGVLVVEGNSALKHLAADFAVFVMTVPFEEFKPSGDVALTMADLVLVDTRGSLSLVPPEVIRGELERRAPGSRVVFLEGEGGVSDALGAVLREAREAIGTGA
ncbi:MAG: hypothetical protein ACYC99_09465 [Candidatus Geothermincolia bacterium]